MQNNQKHLIVVLGMHRSGTSAVTRGLQSLGVSLGHNLIKANEAVNPKGFFEHSEIVEFNERLLSKLGITWHSLVPADYGKISEGEIKRFTVEARLILEKELSAFNLFGIKDPRISLLLPFWKPIFEGICKTSYLIVCRNPLSVAKSLAKRDKFRTEKSLFLWINHYLSILSSLANSKFTVVDYDRMIDAPETELERLASALDLRDGINAQNVRDFCNKFLEQKLRHSIFSLEDTEDQPAVPKSVYELYRTLLNLAEDLTQIANPELSSIISKVKRIHQDLNPAFNLIDSIHEEYLHEISDKSLHIRNIERQSEYLRHQLAQSKSKIDFLEKDLESKIAELQDSWRQQNNAVTALEQIFSSRSWKATEPLRKIAMCFRKPKN